MVQAVMRMAAQGPVEPGLLVRPGPLRPPPPPYSCPYPCPYCALTPSLPPASVFSLSSLLSPLSSLLSPLSSLLSPLCPLRALLPRPCAEGQRAAQAAAESRGAGGGGGARGEQPCRRPAPRRPVHTSGAPPPLPRTNRTRRVPHPVLIGHAPPTTRGGRAARGSVPRARCVFRRPALGARGVWRGARGAAGRHALGAGAARNSMAQARWGAGRTRRRRPRGCTPGWRRRSGRAATPGSASRLRCRSAAAPPPPLCLFVLASQTTPSHSYQGLTYVIG